MKIRKLFDNIEIKIICLLLAVVMWLYASKGSWRLYKSTEATESSKQVKITFREVPIQFTGSPQERWKPNPEKILLEVKCPTAVVATSNFYAEVNLTSTDKANGWVTLTDENVKLPTGLSFVKAEPKEIEITH